MNYLFEAMKALGITLNLNSYFNYLSRSGTKLNLTETKNHVYFIPVNRRDMQKMNYNNLENQKWGL